MKGGSRRSAAAWEFQLERWHAVYAAKRQAYVVHCHPKVTVTPRGPVFSAEGPPDFMGVLSNGKAVSFEAKEVSKGGSLPFKYIQLHQAQALRAVMNHGGEAFVAVRFAELETNVLFDWRALDHDYFEWVGGTRQPSTVLWTMGHAIDSGGWISRYL